MTGILGLNGFPKKFSKIKMTCSDTFGPGGMHDLFYCSPSADAMVIRRVKRHQPTNPECSPADNAAG